MQERLTLTLGRPTAWRAWRCGFQRLRPRPGALQPLHRRARDLRLAPAQRPAADDLRGRPAAPRLRACRGRRAAFVAGARAAAGAGRGLQHRQRRGPLGRARSRALLAEAMGRPDLEPEITGKARVGDIRHCFADIGKARGELGFAPRRDFARGPGRAGRMGGAAGGRRPRRTRPARSSRCGASWHDGADAAARDRRPPAGPGHRRRRLHRLQPRRPPRRARATTCSSSTPSRARASRRNLAWLKQRHPQRDRARASADVRDERGGRAMRPRGATAVFHFAAQVAVTTSLADPREDFEVNVRGTLNLLEALRRRSRAAAARLRLDQQGLRRPRRRRARRRRTTPTCRATRRVRAQRHRRGPAARLPHALWLLQGRRRPVRARLRAQLRPADRRVAHELHLRPAPDGHRGPGLGRALPDPRARRRADHASTATAARCATSSTSPTRSTPISPPGGASTRSQGRAFNLGGGPANAVSLRQLLAHIEDAARPPGRDRLRRLARRRPALLRLRHAPGRARARPAAARPVAQRRRRARPLAGGRARPERRGRAARPAAEALS